MITKDQIKQKLIDGGLKITPQRIIVYETLMKLKDHLTAETIVRAVQKTYPNISVATVYRILETFVDKQLVKKVHTNTGAMKYDPVTEHHHHIFDTETKKIEDFHDDELDRIIEDYFKKKTIPNFEIQDIILHITGKSTGK